MWREAVDADIRYEPNGEKVDRDGLTFGRLDKDSQLIKEMGYNMIPTEIALCFEGIGSIPPTQNVTYNPNWWKERSANVQGDGKRPAPFPLVFRILQLIRQEPQHTRNIGMS